jgi:lipopolysaccharide transport system ATP-binding protein
MAEFAVRFEHISKRYRVGRPRAFTTYFAEGLRKLAGRAGPDQRYWALRDVSFSVAPGESLGVVGSNGAGKTTILKLLSRVTWPTEGRIQVVGRVISLIELGAGFHPDLTGRENIFLHGNILGLRRGEVAARFDDIVEFAGIERYVDTPVKWYSSGMYARLGFSVAAFSNPDVLLIDEVLAVGDASFQRRAVDRMHDFVREGKTVLFVSHDLGKVRGLCRQVLWLDKGTIRAFGDTEHVVAAYLDDVNTHATEQQRARDRTELRGGSGEVRFTSWQLESGLGDRPAFLNPGDALEIRAEFQVFQPVRRPRFRFAIASPEHGVVVCSAESELDDGEWLGQGGTVACRFERLPLRPGSYTVQLAIVGADLVAFYDQVTLGPSFAVAAAGDAGGAPPGALMQPLIDVPSSVRLLQRQPL